MPASIILRSVSYHTPDGKPLLSDLDLAFGPIRTGLIGRNGTGKTTLLRLISGELAPSRGEVLRTGSIGVLRQAVQTEAASIAQALGVAEKLAQLDRLERGDGSLEEATEADWSLPARLEAALAGVHLPALDPARALSTLSGGQQTRLRLAALLLDAPDILLLDEPTNNLDADGRAAVIALLRGWRGAAIVVSHDRAVLREVDAIVELTSLGARSYGGNWEVYRQRQALNLAAAERDLAHAERTLTQIDRKAQQIRERQARKEGAGTRKAARGDQPRILLGGMKRNAETTRGEQSRTADRQRAEAGTELAGARAEIEILQPLSVTLEPSGLARGRTVLQFDGVTGGPDPAQPIIRTLSFALVGPERVAVAGPNGAGKSTLFRLAIGQLQPVTGAIRITPRHALLDQQAALLDPALSIRDNYLRLNPEDGENACRAALARFMFRADAAHQPVGTLSGGETLRAGLACTIGSATPPELLLLDEPTNHLDIHAIEAVETGLRAYDGALLVISHDPDFLAAIGIERTIVLSGTPA